MTKNARTLDEEKKIYAHTKWYKTETEIETNNLLWQVYRILLL